MATGLTHLKAGMGYKDVVRLIEKMGWRHIRTGNYAIYGKDGVVETIRIPRHTVLSIGVTRQIDRILRENC